MDQKKTVNTVKKKKKNHKSISLKKLGKYHCFRKTISQTISLFSPLKKIRNVS